MPALLVNCLVVGLGGFAGAVCRYLFTLVPLPAASGFPLHTLAINFIGSVLIGAVAALAQATGVLDERLVLLLRVGVCGGFTTFSTFALECSDLMATGDYFTAAAYAIASAVLCVAGVFAAQAVVSVAVA